MNCWYSGSKVYKERRTEIYQWHGKRESKKIIGYWVEIIKLIIKFYILQPALCSTGFFFYCSDIKMHGSSDTVI